MPPLSFLILLAVLGLIVARRIGGLRLRIWQSMSLGAGAVLLAGETTPAAALAAVDLDVMAFLFGMFVLGAAMVDSGFLYRLSYRALGRVRSADGLVLAVVLGAGASSALLMNDTLAIVGTPLALKLAREHGLPPRLLLLALAFAVTTGSVMSPIGNPQNLLIAVHAEMPSPFVSFLSVLGFPTLVALGLVWLVLRVAFRRDFHACRLQHRDEPLACPRLARAARIGAAVLLVMVGSKLALVLAGHGEVIRLSWIALAAAVPVLALGPDRARRLRAVDWPSLAFFVALFVLMDSVWQSGFLQSKLAAAPLDLTGAPAALVIGLGASQLVSNVPLVALLLPALLHAAAPEATLLALAAGSTLAGNLLLVGAASNVIIVEQAERRGETLDFWGFARVGIPLTALQAAVYAPFVL